MVERVAGQVPGARGDQQFRLYAYLSRRLFPPEGCRPSLLVLTGKKEAGVWRVVSFTIDRTTTAPPPELLANIPRQALAEPAAADVQTAADSFPST